MKNRILNVSVLTLSLFLSTFSFAQEKTIPAATASLVWTTPSGLPGAMITKENVTTAAKLGELKLEVTGDTAQLLIEALKANPDTARSTEEEFPGLDITTLTLGNNECEYVSKNTGGYELGPMSAYICKVRLKLEK